MASLGIGDRLGSYEILAAIGAGGMGEVYRARDTRLKREVAIKCLPEAWAEDHSRRQRFTQEAQAIALLTHPHICTLYDVVFEREQLFLVMELLEGETLARRLLRQGEGVPIDRQQALAIATELAEALACAHGRQIVHRDLKPANIFLTKAGVKLLDFGLAKLRDGGKPGADDPTRTLLTGTQQVLGTLPYMPPEQLEGRADTRSDIFAFGTVLFEMLTGRRAFEGQSGSIITAAILSHDPMQALGAVPELPANLARVLRRCLNKDPDARWQSAADLADELRWIGDPRNHPVSPAARGHASSTARATSQWIWITAAALVATIGAGIIGYRLSPSTGSINRPAAPQRVTITLPAAAPIHEGQCLATLPNCLALSPDGQQVAYVSSVDGVVPRLYLRALDAFDPRPLEGTDGAMSPFFSPDGRAIAFFAGGALKRVLLGDGAVSTICDVPDGSFRAGAWGPNDVIVFNGPVAERSGLYRVAATGGAPGRLTTPTADEGSHGYPTFVDDGRILLYSTMSPRAGVERAVMAYSLITGQSVRLIEGTGRPTYIDSGHLVFKRNDWALMGVQFDPTTLKVTGSPVPVAENVVDYAVSESGRVVFVRVVRGGRLTWVSRNGRDEAFADERLFQFPRLSPDGTMLAAQVVRDVRRDDVVIFRFANRQTTLLTTDGSSNVPTWSPDGKRIVYRAGNRLVVQSIDGRGAGEPFLDPTDPRLKGARDLSPGAFLPDGSAYVLVVHRSSGTAADIWKLELTGKRSLMPLVEREREQWGVRVSPDGRWISYASNESGPWEIYIEPANGGGVRHKVSSDGGTEGVWARDSRTLFYRSGRRMMAAPIGLDVSAPVGEPDVLFTGSYAESPIPHYDVSADNQRFVMIEAPEFGRTIQMMDGWQPR